MKRIFLRITVLLLLFVFLRADSCTTPDKAPGLCTLISPAPCLCENGEAGTQGCDEQGNLNPCACGCSEGEKALCQCADGSFGNMECLAGNAYGSCECGAPANLEGYPYVQEFYQTSLDSSATSFVKLAVCTDGNVLYAKYKGTAEAFTKWDFGVSDVCDRVAYINQMQTNYPFNQSSINAMCYFWITTFKVSACGG